VRVRQEIERDPAVVHGGALDPRKAERDPDQLCRLHAHEQGPQRRIWNAAADRERCGSVSDRIHIHEDAAHAQKSQ
jgi:hypothetical protein